MIRIILFLTLALNAFAEYPEWLRYGVKVISEFKETSVQQYKEGFGIIINDKLVLTSAHIIYQNKKADEITLYNTETLREPIACLSHARILAVDSNLDLAILEAERFTDIYCNTLPEPNLRAMNFDKTYFNLLFAPLNLPLEDNLNISYFKEQDWSQFARTRIALNKFLALPKDESEKMLGMPLFVENDFLGLRVKEIPNSLSQSLKIGILTHKEILNFLCQLTNETSVFKHREDLKAFCKTFSK